jgi:putative polyhydroxyalkanoate system protein
MADVDVTEKHTLGAAGARAKIADFESMLTEKYGVKASWRGNTADLKGPNVTGSIGVTDADVRVQVSLGFLAKRLVDAKRLEASIRKRLRAAFDAV